MVQDLKNTLESWEDEYGRPFLVHGNRYLDELYAAAAKAAPPPRAKTPSNSGMPTKPATVGRSSAPSRAGTIRGGGPPSRSKTPVSNLGASAYATMSRSTLASSVGPSHFGSSVSASAQKSPSKIPARVPQHGTQNGRTSPDKRPAPPSREDSATLRKMAPPMAPPPRMKDLFVPPEPSAMETPMNRFEFSNRGERSESIVRSIPPEDPYDDRSYMGHGATMRGGYTPTYAPPSLSSTSSRQISQTSSTGTSATGVTMQSGSENWETFSEQSDEPAEEEIDLHAYRRQMKRYTPEGGHIASPRGVQGKKVRGIRSVDTGDVMAEQDSRMARVMEGSEAGWTTDGDGY